MSESAQAEKKLFSVENEVKVEDTEAVLIKRENKKDSENFFYDGESVQTYEFEVVGDDGNIYDAEHKYEPLKDERYLQWINEFEVTVDEGKVDQDIRKASESLWDELVPFMDNVDVPDGQDWQDLIDPDEKIESLQKYLAVVVVEGDKVFGKRPLGKSDTQIIYTEALFEGKPVRQKHVLKRKSEEFRKKYNRIQNKRVKPERTKGLKRTPKLEFHSQEETIGKLYDEHFESQEGFSSNIPLRFKTTVMHWLYGEVLEEKK